MTNDGKKSLGTMLKAQLKMLRFTSKNEYLLCNYSYIAHLLYLSIY